MFKALSQLQASPVGKIEPNSTFNWFRFDLLYVSPKSASNVFIKETTASTLYSSIVESFFDWMFTHYYFIKFLGRDPFGISGIDIKAYFMGKLSVPWGETTKKRVTAKFISSTKHTHNALDDAVKQAEIFEKLLKSST